MKALLEPYAKTLEPEEKSVVGKTDVPLNSKTCQKYECPLGNLITDAFVDFYQNKSPGHKSTQF